MLYDTYFVALTTGGVCLFGVVHSHPSRLPIVVKPLADVSFPGMVCDADAERLGLLRQQGWLVSIQCTL